MAKICRYCEHWETTPKRYRRTDEFDAHLRLCPFKEQPITENEETCKHFAIHNYFFCDNTGYRMKVEVCFHKYKQKEETCINCPQFHDLVASRRGVRNNQEPVIVRRRRNDQS